MASYNKVVLVGNLCADPVIRYTGSGTGVCDLRLAVTTKRKAGDETLFVDVTTWDKQAENCCQYLNKGSQVLVDGRLVLDEWNDKDTGQKRSKISVTAQVVQFLNGCGGNGGGGGNEGGAPVAAPQPQQQQQQMVEQAAGVQASSDIPF